MAESARANGKNPPEKDINRLVRRFHELRDPVRRNKLQDLFHHMSLFPQKPKPAEIKAQKDLFSFNPASIVGFDTVQRMYALNKCLSCVSQCLMIDYKSRPEAREIGLHPFLKSQYKEYIRLEPEIEDIINQNMSRAGRKHLWKDYSSAVTIHEVNKIIKEKEEKLKQTVLGRQMRRR